MVRVWKHRLKDLIEAMLEIREFAKDLDFKQLQFDRRTQKAIIFNFIIIGEAAKNLPNHIKDKYSHIPWKEIYKMRNFMVHEY